MRATSTAELRARLQDVLSRHFGRPCGVVRFQRAPSLYRASFCLEELAVVLDDGTTLAILFKDLGRRALADEARRVKPVFLYDPLREIETYQQILSAGPPGTALCYGAVVDPAAERYWLFLEKVAGRELYQVGELAAWEQVAGWLAVLHTRLAGQAERLARVAHLVVYDPAFYRLWPGRALAFLAPTSGARRGLEHLASRYDRVVERLRALPATVLHGELYAANVLVQETGGQLRVCPVDWEMAAHGPGLIDLAALTAGKWTDAKRAALVQAYYAALASAGAGWADERAFLEALDYCRLHLAVQWLGWAPDWVPPPAQAQDWLGEALRLAEQLGL
jgi:hypothetical protein